MKVMKYSGELVDFDPHILKASLAKSGAVPEEVEQVWQTMIPDMHEGMQTKDIYHLAFKLLKQQADVYAARYSLKRALAELGPTGYVFEKWIARIFEHAQYQTVTGRTVQGNAVSHEIDVLANKGEETLLVECKFRNTEDSRVDVKNPMYLLSRFKDVQEKSYVFFDKKLQFTNVWLATNTQLTKDAISFAEYYHIHVLSWDYPAESSIKRRVDDAGLYPITCLTTLAKTEKTALLKKDCIMVKELLSSPVLLAEAVGTASKRIEAVNKEASELVQGVRQ